MTKPPFTYTIIRSRRKTVAIIVNARGEVTVRAPLHAAQSAIEGFVQAKQTWVLKKQAEVSQHAAAGMHQFAAGETFAYRGKFYPLEIVADALPALVLADGAFRLSAAAQGQAARIFSAWYRAQARRLVRDRLEFYSGRYAFSYQKVRITSARTRWGSCTTRGTLSFSWRVATLPPDLLDYVIAHELCHLLQPNHSPAFWSEVERILPDVRARRKRLKEWSSQVF